MPFSCNLLYASVNLSRATAACVPEGNHFLVLSWSLFMEKSFFILSHSTPAPVFDLSLYWDRRNKTDY